MYSNGSNLIKTPLILCMKFVLNRNVLRYVDNGPIILRRQSTRTTLLTLFFMVSTSSNLTFHNICCSSLSSLFFLFNKIQRNYSFHVHHYSDSLLRLQVQEIKYLCPCCPFKLHIFKLLYIRYNCLSF